MPKQVLDGKKRLRDERAARSHKRAAKKLKLLSKQTNPKIIVESEDGTLDNVIEGEDSMLDTAVEIEDGMLDTAIEFEGDNVERSVDFTSLADNCYRCGVKDMEIEILKKENASLKLKVESLEKVNACLTSNLDIFQTQISDRNTRINELTDEVKEEKFCYSRVSSDLNTLNFFTGIGSTTIFIWILSRVRSLVKIFHSSRLSIEDHLLLVMMKLKLGLLNKDIAFRFRISPSIVSKIFRNWIPSLAAVLENCIVWPERPTIRHNLPNSFKKKLVTVIIIDCSEILIERPNRT